MARHGGKRFLLVPYHMLGAQALEQRVLGGYVSHVKKLHPDAPTPRVYRTDSLFADIRAVRADMGDAAVIRGLGTTGGGDGEEEDEWGEGFAWSPELLDSALAAEDFDPRQHYRLTVSSHELTDVERNLAAVAPGAAACADDFDLEVG